MPKRSTTKNTSDLAGKLADLAQKINVDPTDPRFWQSHFKPVAVEGLKLAHEAKAAGLGEQAIGYLIPLATYLGLAAEFDRAIEAGTLAVEFASAIEESQEPYAAAILPLAYAIGEHESQSKAKKLLKEALRIREKLHGKQSLPVAEVLYHLGGLARNSVELDDSFEYFERCMKIREALLPSDHVDQAAALDAFGLSHYYLDRPEGVDYVKRALDIRERTLPGDHPWLAESLNNLAMFYELLEEDFDKAAMYRRCLAISEKWYGPAHSEIAIHAENLGMTLQEQGEFAEAEALFRRVIQMTEQLHGDSAESLPMHIQALVDCLCKADKPEEAAQWMQRGVKLLRDHEENSESKLRWLCQFANSCSELHLEQEAIEIYLEIIDSASELEDPEFEVAVLENLASSLEAIGEVEAALERYNQALQCATAEFGSKSEQAADLRLRIRFLKENN